MVLLASSIMLFMLCLLKLLTATKMLIMFMSLEMASVILYVIFMYFVCGSVSIGLGSLFLVMLICEGVVVLMCMVNVYRVGSSMAKSISILKF